MSTFALVHGAWHGAWCWERLTPELEALGHRVITPDLPVDDPSASFDDYAAVVCAAVAAQPGDDLILVGHSLAGLTVPLVAAQRPMQRLVYLCAFAPIPDVDSTHVVCTEDRMLKPDWSRRSHPSGWVRVRRIAGQPLAIPVAPEGARRTVERTGMTAGGRSRDYGK